MTTLTPEQRVLGRENANTALGISRRDFLKAAAVAPALGAFYFGYKSIDKPVRAAIIGTGNEGCQAMIHDHNREYVNFIGYCDLRPTQQKRAVKEFSAHPQYTPEDVKKLRQYADIDVLLADPDVEMLVIALPLWLHAPIAIKAVQAGKHVFCEKLMAHSVGECKAMVRAAHKANRLLAIGHQRHYSVLYENANYLVSNGHLGEIRHIRALWHRNNACPMIAKDKDGKLKYDEKGEPVYIRDEAGNIAYFDSWKPPIPEDDKKVDFARYGYKSLDELVRWRLYDRTGAGLMAELGSHQLDACSIFLGKKHPLSVVGIGGTFFFKDGREVDDHVFVNFEFPGKDKDDRVIVTYSSINTNAFEKYGEEVMGTRGTMVVEEERDLMLYKEADRNIPKDVGGRTTSITMEKGPAGKPVIETSPSASGPTAASSLGGLATAAPSRGYREELEHFAFCLRNGNQSDYHGDEEHRPHCRGEVALADAVIALTSNLAMRQKKRIEFKESWFDYTSPDVPDGSANDLAMGG
ncbi:MAG TPA: Gfo/Idh/MocA family oxidoreductase [Isosphaeraceae bacterium]|jgi:predicted dehydrogenase|nr:Gfo/Idh/MocA family oxidoreductase [Isosphaeraceae bacterium]